MISRKTSEEVSRFQWFWVQKGTPTSARQCATRAKPSSLKAVNWNPSSAFTLFEVMIALGVVAMAVTGLAIALETAVEAALDARERSLARMQIESRLAIAMADPPPNGRRVIEARDNNGIWVEETLVPYEVKTSKGTNVPGLWKLKIVAATGGREGSKGNETAEILLYRP